MSHWQNLELKALSETHDGVLYIEKWKPIKGYEQFYKVSSFGRVKSINWKSRKAKELILRQSFTKGGYLFVKLYSVDSKSEDKQYSIHRLVGIAFIPNPLNLPEINHKKGIKSDNRVHQLEWSTIGNNRKHAYEIGLIDKDKVKSMLGKFGELHHNSKKVRQYDLDGNFINEYAGTREAARISGFCQTSISKVARNKSGCHANYQWRFVGDEDTVAKGATPYGPGAGHKQSKAVFQYDLDGVFLNQYANAGVAESVTGINRMQIGANCRGTLSTAGGYKWEYCLTL